MILRLVATLCELFDHAFPLIVSFVDIPHLVEVSIWLEYCSREPPAWSRSISIQGVYFRTSIWVLSGMPAIFLY